MSTIANAGRRSFVAGLVAVACIGASLLGACARVDDNLVDDSMIQVGELRALMAERDKKPGANSLLLLDTRLPRQFAEGHIPGAQPINIAAVDDRARAQDPSIAKFNTKIVYGNDPADTTARALVKKMLTAGYEDVRLFPGGWAEWKRTGGGTVGTSTPAK